MVSVLRHFLSILLAIGLSALAMQNISAQVPDKQSGTVSLAAANSIGKLWIPGIRYKDGRAQNYTEQCSATLVTTNSHQATSRFLLSAWHCIEDYKDLSKTIYFESSNGKRYESRIVVSGGGMHSDWALLRLTDSLSPVVVLTDQSSEIGGPLEMAGFPRPNNVAESASSSWGLQVESCHTTGRDFRDWSSDCVLTKGASGGAVLDLNGHYIGVISRGDSASQSIFVATDRFRSAISRYLH